MGPRFCKRGNDGPEPVPSALIASLQWGHAFVSVETVRNKARYAAFVIGLQWGHAFVSVETSGALELPEGLRELQWGHAFVSVETTGSR